MKDSPWPSQDGPLRIHSQEARASKSSGSLSRPPLNTVIAKIAVQGLLISGLLLWGGLGLLTTSNAVEVAGTFRIQDLLTAGLSTILGLTLILQSKLQKRVVFVIASLVAVSALGILTGLVQGNGLTNIAFELRPLLYSVIGAVILLTVDTPFLEKWIQRYALVLAVAIIIQFGLTVLGVNLQFVSGINTNRFTLDVPIVRPPGGYQIVGLGLIMALLAPKGRLRQADIGAIGIMVVAILITQSKTYWILCLLALIWGSNQRLRGLRIPRQVVPYTAILLLTGILILLFALTRGESAIDLLLIPWYKFVLVFLDSGFEYVVVGIRLEEARLMVEPLTSSLFSAVFGKGLGFIYRDPSLFFYMPNPRDLERLAMFGHNHFLWVILKLGIAGSVVYLSAIGYALVRGFSGSAIQNRFALTLVSLLISAALLGSLQNPAGGFIFGLLIAGSVKYGIKPAAGTPLKPSV